MCEIYYLRLGYVITIHVVGINLRNASYIFTVPNSRNEFGVQYNKVKTRAL